MGADRYLGSAQDPPLSRRGATVAAAAGRRLAGIRPAVVVVSPLRRCTETAALALPGAATTEDARWSELDFGLIGGLSWAEVEARMPQVAAAWRRDGVPDPPGGEAPVRLWLRVAEAMLELASAHPRGEVVVVTHGGPIRAALGLARGLDLADLWRVRAPLGGLRSLRLGDAALARLAGVAAGCGAVG